MAAMTTSDRTDQVACGDAGSMTLHLWQPDGPARSAVLLIQEIFGVGEHIRAVAERLAAAGYVVGAPDVFWRIAPGWESPSDEAGMQASFATVQRLDGALAVADCAAALAHLQALPGVERAGVMGFCLGGTLAWGVAAAGRPAACVSYYGSGVPGMLDQLDHVECPTLFHFGNNDPFIPNEGVDALAAAIAGRPGFVVNVEIAGHAFDNHTSDMFYDEAAARAAWAKTMAFLAEHLPA